MDSKLLASYMFEDGLYGLQVDYVIITQLHQASFNVRMRN